MKTQVKTLLEANPILPGTLEKRYNICGKAGCACKRKVNPRKHGPYYRLSYNIKGKNSSVFVSEEDAEKVMKMTENYRNARSVTQELALAMVESYRQNGLQKTLEQYTKLIEKEARKRIGKKPESAVLRDARNSRDKWKVNAKDRHAKLEKSKVKIRDLSLSRDKWKEKAITAHSKLKELEKKFSATEQQLANAQKQNELKKN